MQNKIILIVGESGSGKTSIVKELYLRYGLSAIDSYTTRERRYINEAGHIFITEDEMDELLENEEIVAYTDFDGHRYCATATQVEENDLYVVDVYGVEFFDEHYTGNKDVIMVYIKVDEDTRYCRMAEERDAEDAMQRIQHDKIAFKNAEYMADVVVENYDLDEAIDNIYKIWKM